MNDIKFLVCDLSLIERPELHQYADDFISYEDGNYWKSEHPPSSWHSYAAAMKGRIFGFPRGNLKENVEWADMILVTFCYHPKATMDIINNMKKKGKVVIGAFHENGSLFQHLANQNMQWIVDFKNCANACDAFITGQNMQWVVAQDKYHYLYQGMCITTEILDCPVPIETSIEKNYIVPIEDRRGLFIGPSKKDSEIDKRNWVFDIFRAVQSIRREKIHPRITTVNQSEKISNEKLIQFLKNIDDTIEWNVVSKLTADEYLKLLSTHQYIVNFDDSDTQGQCDMEALLVNVPPVPNEYGQRTSVATSFLAYADAKNKQGEFTLYELANLYVHEFHSYDRCKSILTQFFNRNEATKKTQK